MKKELYYTAETLIFKATEFVNELQRFRDKHPWQLKKSQVALLVIDMQDFFLQKKSRAFIPSAAAIIEPVKQLQDLFLSRNLMVLQTQQNNSAVNMLKWWGSTSQDDDSLMSITPTLVNPKIPIVHKKQYDAFLQTDLAETLQSHGITQIFITGVMAHICCETTARSSFMRGFETFFVVDATATYNEDLHRATLLNLAHGFAVPVLTQEIKFYLEITNA